MTQTDWRIRLYAVDQDNGEQTLIPTARVLSDCFEAGDDEERQALRELRQQGRAWIGGGAAQLFLIMSLER